MGGPGSGGKGKWQSGQSGNPAGKPKQEQCLSQLLRKFGDKKIATNDPKKKIKYKEALIQKMWHLALKGDSVIAKEIINRIDGPVRNINENHNFNDGEEIENDALAFIRSDLLRTKQYVHPWYQPAPFHREIVNYLMDESIRRLIVTLPPQFGKSEILCKTFPAWFLANNPEKSVIVGSYNQEYANKLSVQCRDFFNEPKFMKLFGEQIQLHKDAQTKHEWMLAGHKGSNIFSGVGGTITGNSADVFLIDDVTKDFEDASSKVMQEKIWYWYNSVAGTRLQGEKSRIIIIMTRWMKNDLVGRILAQEEENNTPEEDRFKVLHYPAILDVQNDDYSTGRSLWPEKKTMKFLLERQQKEPSVFRSLWQGSPRDLEGLIINPKWIKIETDIKSLGKLIMSCRGWDFGYTESGDETVGAKLDVYENGEQITTILSDVIVCRKDPTAVKELVIDIAQKDGPDVIIGVESGGTQIAMSSDLMKRKELMAYQVRPITPKGDKVSRAMSWILKLEDGVFRLTPGTWNKTTIAEMVDFSNECMKDNIEDAITNAWKILWGVL